MLRPQPSLMYPRCALYDVPTSSERRLPFIVDAEKKEKFLQATSSDTLRSRATTGKPARQLRSTWTDAWEDPANPHPLPMPLQTLLTTEAIQHIQQDALQGGEGGKTLINYFVGQSVGMLNQIRPAAEVYQSMRDECEAVLQRLAQTK